MLWICGVRRELVEEAWELMDGFSEDVGIWDLVSVGVGQR